MWCMGVDIGVLGYVFCFYLLENAHSQHSMFNCRLICCSVCRRSAPKQRMRGVLTSPFSSYLSPSHSWMEEIRKTRQNPHTYYYLLSLLPSILYSLRSADLFQFVWMLKREAGEWRHWAENRMDKCLFWWCGSLLFLPFFHYFLCW